MILLQNINDFLSFEKLGIIGVLAVAIYFLWTVLKTQITDLRTEVLSLKAENKELRETIIEMQANLLEFMNTRPQKRSTILR
jgi:hypothetical protein